MGLRMDSLSSASCPKKIINELNVTKATKSYDFGDTIMSATSHCASLGMFGNRGTNCRCPVRGSVEIRSEMP
jgi:hypothetical protein